MLIYNFTLNIFSLILVLFYANCNTQQQDSNVNNSRCWLESSTHVLVFTTGSITITSFCAFVLGFCLAFADYTLKNDGKSWPVTSWPKKKMYALRSNPGPLCTFYIHHKKDTWLLQYKVMTMTSTASHSWREKAFSGAVIGLHFQWLAPKRDSSLTLPYETHHHAMHASMTNVSHADGAFTSDVV
jgi:hypothetical protein